MATWIGLFRGINVGGNNILPMAKLRSELESLKLKNVRKYIQSGNVIFDSTARSAQLNINKLIDAGILEEATGKQRNRIYVAMEIIAAIEAD